MKTAAAVIQRIVKDPMVGTVDALPMMMKGMIVAIVMQNEGEATEGKAEGGTHPAGKYTTLVFALNFP